MKTTQSFDVFLPDGFHGSGIALTPTLSPKRERGRPSMREDAVEPFPWLRGKSLPRTRYGVPKADGGRPAPVAFPLWLCIKRVAVEQIFRLQGKTPGADEKSRWHGMECAT